MKIEDMNPGIICMVRTKFYGDKMGVIIKKTADRWGVRVLIEPFDHPRRISAEPQDIIEAYV